MTAGIGLGGRNWLEQDRNVLRGEVLVDHIQLPLGDEVIGGVLQGAVAAPAAMQAGGGDAVGRGRHDPRGWRAGCLWLALDDFTRQGARDVDGACGYAVAEMAETLDGEVHSAASSVPMNPPDCRFQ